MGQLIPFEKGERTMDCIPTVFEVANYFLKMVDRESGSSITHLKLQKLVYYAQAWHLVFAGKTMFDSRIEAWVHGPVCPELYVKYKESSYENLPEPRDPLYPFSPEQVETLDEVWQCYGDYDGKYLEELTHQEVPWREARKGIPAGEHCTQEISLSTMKEFYTKLKVDGEN